MSPDRSPADARRDARRQVGEFLTARRAAVTPEQAGLPSGLGPRRVPGLRREEVALLAGISVEYYSKLERGTIGEVSPAVVDALAGALRLDRVESAHLDALLDAASGRTPGTPAGDPDVRGELTRLLELLEPAAAFVRNGRLDVLAANRSARALYAGVFDQADARPGSTPNLARYLFADTRSHETYVDWSDLADNAVGTLRAELGRHPGDAALTSLIAELTSSSADFAARWRDHAVRRYQAGTQRFRVGDPPQEIELAYEALDVVADPGLTVLVYSAAPGSPDALVLHDLGARVPGWTA